LRALLLAAGYGTRLRPLTEKIPKCLVPIRGKPLLAYWFDLLLDGGIERLLVNTHYLPTEVQTFVATSRWRNAVELVHEPVLLGTGGTVLQNRYFFGDQAFMVVHSDNLSLFDPRAFTASHMRRPNGCALTMMTFDTDAPETCGIVVLDEQGVVREMHEKVANPPGHRANAAVYIFEPEIASFIESLGKKIVDISTEVLPHFLGRTFSYQNSSYHRDIGSLESLAKAEKDFPAVLR
jgi:mannose-1-phosphate guanylyltransferase